MKELALAEIKEIELDLLVFFQRFCSENGLKFFLSNGTLLGAVKYGGFIPWDDDVDVFMPRGDYDRLIRIFKDTKQYRLFSIEREPLFAFPFAKLCNRTTHKVEFGAHSAVPLGLDIDIFPLDVWDGSPEEARSVIRSVQSCIKMLGLAKLPFQKGRNVVRTAAKILVLCAVKCVGAKALVKRILRIVKRKSVLRKGTFAGCFVWPVYGEKEIIPAGVFDDAVEVRFEDHAFPAPAGFDVYLRSLYGDYEKDPPPEKQRTHHRFCAYRCE